MAQVHNQLSKYTHLSRAFKNALGLDEGGLERADESLQATLPLFEQPEYSWQRGEWRGILYENKAAGGAGTYAGVGFGVPDTGRLLVVVEPESTAMVVAGAVSYYEPRWMTYTAFAAAYGTAASCAVLDSRPMTQGPPNIVQVPLVARSGVPAAPPGAALALLYTNDALPMRETIASVGPVVVTPGFAFVLSSVAANAGLRANIRLRARIMQPGESSA